VGVSSKLWNFVYDREEGRCIVPRLDPGAGACRNAWGDPVRLNRDGTYRREDVTFAHIKMVPGGKRVDDARHGVLACWGHHVFGRMWITSGTNLELVRAHLRELYGDDYD
jgi:hypothetical protein